MVYELLNENGLCTYYEMNERPGMAQRIPVRKDKFAFLEDDKVQQKLIHFQDHQQTHVKGELPISRGHILNQEDLLLRRHIQDLMCQFSTGWTRLDVNCDAVTEGLQRLQELEQDGLVKVEPAGVAVTEKGRPFIRNICMAFDARLWRGKPGTRIFSSSI